MNLKNVFQKLTFDTDKWVSIALQVVKWITFFSIKILDKKLGKDGKFLSQLKFLWKIFLFHSQPLAKYRLTLLLLQYVSS